VPDGRTIKLLVPEAYPKRPARAVTALTVRFIGEMDSSRDLVGIIVPKSQRIRNATCIGGVRHEAYDDFG
jgi:hypothetical protein